MPHLRNRFIFALLKKRVKLWPVLGLMGPRQVGKSTLLRDVLAPSLKAVYLSFDRKSTRDQAARAPEYFLKTAIETPSQPLILDEAQKVPDIFDAIKAEVDEARHPGRYILSGSTDFSQKTGIRESLTGRIGIARLYPLTLAETQARESLFPWVTGTFAVTHTPKDIKTALQKGGMPGACFLRDRDEARLYFDSWLDTTCHKDLSQIRQKNLSGDLALDILSALSKHDVPTLSEVAATLRVDARRIKAHVEALEALFLLHRLDAHPLGVGKSEYLVFDAGLAHHLGASELRCLKIFAVNECLAQHEYRGKSRPRLYHYQSSKKSSIDLVIKTTTEERAVVLSLDETPDAYAFRAVHAFQKKEPAAKGFVCAPTNAIFKEGRTLTIVPWTAMA